MGIISKRTQDNWSTLKEMVRSVSNVGGIVHSGLDHEVCGGSGDGDGGGGGGDFLVRHNYLTQ
jgi:hypothetical protein